MKQKAPHVLTVEPKDIFVIGKNGVVYLGGESLTLQEVKGLQEEIKYLNKTRIWSILTNTLATQAKEIMFEKSETFDDMRTGKAILLAIQQMKKITSALLSIKQS